MLLCDWCGDKIENAAILTYETNVYRYCSMNCLFQSLADALEARLKAKTVESGPVREMASRLLEATMT